MPPRSRAVDEQRVDLGLRVRRVPRALAHVDQLGVRACLVQQLGADQAVVHDDVGRPEQLEPARGDEPGIAGAAADEVHGPRLLPDVRHHAGPEPRRGRRRMSAREVHHDLLQPRVGADGVVDQEQSAADAAPARVRSVGQSHQPGNVLQDVRAAADEERHYQHGGLAEPGHDRVDRGVVVEERRDDLARHLAAPERVGELLGGGAALRMARGAVAHQHERHRVAQRALLAQELGDATGHERRHAGVRAHRRRLPEPHVGEAAVAAERLGQHHLAVVAGAGEERHHGHLVGRELVEHAVESGLALVERHRHFVEQPAAAQRLGQPADERVGRRIAAGAVRGEHQRAAAHRATSSGTRSIVGSSRPVTTERTARRPMSRW